MNRTEAIKQAIANKAFHISDTPHPSYISYNAGLLIALDILTDMLKGYVMVTENQAKDSERLQFLIYNGSGIWEGYNPNMYKTPEDYIDEIMRGE